MPERAVADQDLLLVLSDRAIWPWSGRRLTVHRGGAVQAIEGQPGTIRCCSATPLVRNRREMVCLGCRWQKAEAGLCTKRVAVIRTLGGSERPNTNPMVSKRRLRFNLCVLYSPVF